MFAVYPWYPEEELMLERLTRGTVVTGVLPTMGFWPIDMSRALKSPTPLEEITFDFTQ